mgnify:FL=1
MKYIIKEHNEQELATILLKLNQLDHELWTELQDIIEIDEGGSK